MKKYLEIMEEIKKARGSARDTAKAEKALELALFQKAAKHGSEEEKQAARAAFRAACTRFEAEALHNTKLKMMIEILTENAKQALFSEIIGTVCEIWNKYAGRPHGEKTAKKIRDEIKSATGHGVFIGNKYGSAHITIWPAGTCYEITIGRAATGEDLPALDRNNKILKLSPDGLRVWYCGEYVRDVNAHIDELLKAHAAALAARDAYREAIDKYNSLTRGGIQRASESDGVKSYII